ncbi:hypothetical protein GALL_26100 [mine drainage metagenome]|uniref:Uncharacterized protein n=1 Tax=mine drainage metagenome TaxID=410659 RepID=A0A1J5TXM7_9ZZZZ
MNTAIDNTSSFWISTPELSQLSGIAEQNARAALSTCFNGGQWRGTTLQVRKTGKGYLVDVRSLPPGLFAAWLEKNNDIASAPAIPKSAPLVPHYDPQAGTKSTLAAWKISLIAAAIQHPKKSRDRAELLKDASAAWHVRPDGKRVRVSIRTLQNWIDVFNQEGILGLQRKTRTEKKPKRVYVNREWDAACPLSEIEKQRLSDEINQYVRSLVIQQGDVGKKIELLASSKLLELCREAGWKTANQAQCKVGRHLVRQHQDGRIVAVKEKDAKRFADKYTPRILRTREGLQPLDIIVGDVHPVDILVRREDGSEATPRMIAWLDLATNDFFYTLHLLDKGKGVTQAMIAASFAEMVEEWGLPRALYLDNGAEYNWTEMMEGFATLRGLLGAFDVFLNDHAECPEPNDARQVVTRAKPHNPPAKAIEGGFSVLEKYFSMIPGYIGGNRMYKRTHKVGKSPVPYPGTWEGFQEEIKNVMAMYRAAPQDSHGALNGLSPTQAWSGFIESEWIGVNVSREVLIYAFSEELRPMVRNSGIEIGGAWYFNDALLKHIGSRVTVRYAKWAADYVLYQCEAGSLVHVHKAPVFGVFDRAGAIEQARRAGVQAAAIRSLKSGVEPLHLVDEIARHAATLPPAEAKPKGTAISLLSAELQQVEQAAAAPQQTNPPKRLNTGEIINKKTGETEQLLAYSPPPKKEAPKIDFAALNKPERPENKSPTKPSISELIVKQYGTPKR